VRASNAQRRIDATSAVGIGLIAIGWFGMDSFNVAFPGYSQGTRFYQMLVILRHPAVLFTGIGGGHGLEVAVFTLLCVLALLAVLAPLWSTHRAAWLAAALPLALMLACFALLNSGSPGWQVEPASSSHALREDLLRFANDVMQRAQNHIARHVSLGAGGILSLLASAVLALRGTLMWLRTRRSP
jgi:hypothetical protein